MNVFLKGHAGAAPRVDRRGRPPETIEHPALTHGICTQPAARANLAGPSPTAPKPTGSGAPRARTTKR